MSDTTGRTIIEGAAHGDRRDQEEFVWRYSGVVRAYLTLRWRRSWRATHVDDAVQDVLFECLRTDGILARMSAPRRSFRALLLAATRIVALRFESRHARRRDGGHATALDDVPACDAHPSRAFDRAWVRTILDEATRYQTERAESLGPAARRRVELLRLRFAEELPIRRIAELWQVEAAAVHRDYARARVEYRDALGHVLRSLHPEGHGLDLDQACDELLAILDQTS